MMKHLLPNTLKLQIKLLIHYFKDVINGAILSFPKKTKHKFKSEFVISKTQIIKKSSSVAAKIINLKTASTYVSQYQINPNNIFSFWKAIGNPVEKRGFKSGRTIINDELLESVGGGLCQLAGLIYHVSLEGGLNIIERYNHSVDLYNEDTRYTPIGSDAAVVYGYKDLRIKNPYNFAIRYEFEITEAEITISLCSEAPIEMKDVVFKKVDANNSDEKKIETYVSNKLSAISIYKELKQ